MSGQQVQQIENGIMIKQLTFAVVSKKETFIIQFKTEENTLLSPTVYQIPLRHTGQFHDKEV